MIQIIIIHDSHSMYLTTLTLPSYENFKVVIWELFTSKTFDKLKDVTATVGTLKCQLIHVFVNSGQINSLKDKIIIHRFDSSRLMAWPLKCHVSKHFI